MKPRRRPGRPTAETLTGARVIGLRARLIALMTRTVLSADDIATLLERPLGSGAPARSVIEADIAPASGADRRPMDARRWAIYAAFVDMVTVEEWLSATEVAPATVDVALRGALTDVDKAEDRLRRVFGRLARAGVPDAYRAFPIGVPISEDAANAWYVPGYHREILRVYLRAVRKRALELFASRLRHGGGATLSEAIRAQFDGRASRTPVAAEELERRRLHNAIQLWRATRRSTLNLQRDFPLGNPAKPLSEGEQAVYARLFGFNQKGVPIVSLQAET